MKKIITVIMLLAALQGKSQENKVKSKPVFQSINQLGFLTGETGNAFQIQSVNGIRVKNFFTGVGVGIDEYHTRSIPLFLDMRLNLVETGKSLFFYADAGTHFIWPKEPKEDVYYNSYIKQSYDKGGLFYDLGLGYSLPVKSNAILLSAGYSFKSFTGKEQTYYYWSSSNPDDYIKNEYKLRRVSIKAAFSF